MLKKILFLSILVFFTSFLCSCDKPKGKNQYYQNPGNSYSNNNSQDVDTKRWRIQQLEFQIQQLDWKIQQESNNFKFYQELGNSRPSMTNAQLQYNSRCLLQSYMEEGMRLQTEKNKLEAEN